MKYVILIFAFFAAAQSAYSQFSVFGKYQSNSIEWQDDWSRVVGSDAIYGSSTVGGLAYWLRLKNYRVEFHPGVYYSRSSLALAGDIGAGLDPTIASLSNADFSGIGLELPVHFYILDFEGDCNCPTFSKDGGALNKGLFLFLTPGYFFQSIVVDGADANGSALSFESKNNSFTLSGGLGFDIGFGDLFTISPFGGLHLSPSNTWDGLNQIISVGEDIQTTRNLRSLVAGIRLSFRPDYVKEQKGMFR